MLPFTAGFINRLIIVLTFGKAFIERGYNASITVAPLYERLHTVEILIKGRSYYETISKV